MPEVVDIAIQEFMKSTATATSTAKNRDTQNSDPLLDVLVSIRNILSEQVPLGVNYTIPGGVSVTEDIYIDFTRGIISSSAGNPVDIPTYRNRALFAISIENEGPNDCFVVINYEQTNPRFIRTINKGEVYEVNMGRAVIKMLKLSVNVGQSCTVQISGVI